jgi:hypothetical protein
VTDGRVLPRGCLVRYREWYGMKPGQPNVGVKINADVIGLSIAAREKDEKISYGVLDPSAFAEDGGPSLAERISKGSGNKVHFRRADNRRVAGHGAIGGWDQMRARLVGDKDGRAISPMTSIMSSTTPAREASGATMGAGTGTGASVGSDQTRPSLFDRVVIRFSLRRSLSGTLHQTCRRRDDGSVSCGHVR